MQWASPDEFPNPWETSRFNEFGGVIMNIHEECENYNAKKDMCLKWFEENVSENYDTCKEKTVFNDADLQRKWSN